MYKNLYLLFYITKFIMQETEVNFKELYFYPPRCRYLDKQLLRCVKWLHNLKIYMEHREDFRIVYCQVGTPAYF
jgi:hypothetical protein